MQNIDDANITTEPEEGNKKNSHSPIAILATLSLPATCPIDFRIAFSWSWVKVTVFLSMAPSSFAFPVTLWTFFLTKSFPCFLVSCSAPGLLVFLPGLGSASRGLVERFFWEPDLSGTTFFWVAGLFSASESWAAPTFRTGKDCALFLYPNCLNKIFQKWFVKNTTLSQGQFSTFQCRENTQLHVGDKFN